MEATMNKKTNKTSKKDRIQALLERQQRHLWNDKFAAVGITLATLIPVAGLL
jgi:hypothetical protein